MTKLNLPASLLGAMQEQRAVLFLGSGASLGSVAADGREMPTSKKLSEGLCDRFLSSKYKNKSLMRVAALAASQAGKS